MLKKFLIYSLTVAVLFGAGFFGANLARKRYHSAPSHGNPAYIQVRASHMLSFLDDDGEQTVWCSGTAIGPHAILTAAHCNDASDNFKTLNLDRSTRVYKLLASSFDGRDHVIVLVDGPAFTDIAPYVTREPQIGEPILIEGFGEEVYPALEKHGNIVTVYDPSEVDANQKMFYFNAPVIHGDSGAAIFGLDGAILGVVTWHIDAHTSAGQELDYPPLIIHEAQTFQGLDKK